VVCALGKLAIDGEAFVVDGAERWIAGLPHDYFLGRDMTGAARRPLA